MEDMAMESPTINKCRLYDKYYRLIEALELKGGYNPTLGYMVASKADMNLLTKALMYIEALYKDKISELQSEADKNRVNRFAEDMSHVVVADIQELWKAYRNVIDNAAFTSSRGSKVINEYELDMEDKEHYDTGWA